MKLKIIVFLLLLISFGCKKQDVKIELRLAKDKIEQSEMNKFTKSINPKNNKPIYLSKDSILTDQNMLMASISKDPRGFYFVNIHLDIEYINIFSDFTKLNIDNYGVYIIDDKIHDIIPIRVEIPNGTIIISNLDIDLAKRIIDKI